jgi:leucyl aminopeptidase
MGMGLLLGVARGSSEEPRFIHVVYRPEGYPAGDQASPTHAPAGDDGGRPPPRPRRVALVGKGVTFDSGGLSLKTTPQMLDMKADMAGAAAVLAAVGALADLRASCEVHAIAACVENMPSGHASRIGDVLRSLSGKTVEISNTDAEGRLLLGDALTYAARQEVDEIVDLATLTSACVVALGKETAGLMGSDPAAVERFAAAARMAGEDVWPLPLPQRLRETLKSEVADLKNTGDRFGGALVAGLFLREFVGATSWLHLDIAGPAVAEKAWGHLAQGGTGFGVATLIEYLAPSQPLPPGPQDS